MTARMMHLGLMFWATGTHPAGWRHPSARADAAYDIALIQQVSQAAERARLDFIFLGDRLASDPTLQHSNPAQISRLEPFVAATAIAAATERIGIVVTANPTYSDPYGIARLLASLDHVSGGRAAWNLVTGADPAAAGNFGRTEHWPTDRRYDWAEETLVVVRALWDSEPGRPVRHRGTYFSVDGPLDVGRPPQGQVVLLNAGTSDRARELSASAADVVFAGPQPDLEARAEFYADIKARAARHGRADDVTILPGLIVVVAPTTREAVARYDALNALLPLDPEREPGTQVRAGGLGEGLRHNRGSAARLFGIGIPDDLSAAVPAAELAAVAPEARQRLADITRLTRRTATGPDRITYADLVHACPTQPAHTVVGSPTEVADMMQDWFERGLADGFNVYPSTVPGSVTDFTELVVPELQRRGLFRTEYAGTMLRDHLGLPVPARRQIAA
ncbi:LLM class flavin-dependent oxidoreductase [Micromonospora sp. HNM0581]|uniref:LLM class flavin-dependent oxidoreductase n=1 Tax=Micromonospora sp. HNM0581 TaxID=2716341 RepID=UPI0032164A35